MIFWMPPANSLCDFALDAPTSPDKSNLTKTAISKKRPFNVAVAWRCFFFCSTKRPGNIEGGVLGDHRCQVTFVRGGWVCMLFFVLGVLLRLLRLPLLLPPVVPLALALALAVVLALALALALSLSLSLSLSLFVSFGLGRRWCMSWLYSRTSRTPRS